MLYPIIQLKKGKEAAIGHGHPWVFSGAIDKAEDTLESGDLVTVLDSSGAVVGVGTFSKASSIAVRLMSRTETVINREWFASVLRASNARRVLAGLGVMGSDEGYRVVFGEADGMPGVVIDRYGDVAVVQLSTAGVDRLREEIADAIIDALGVTTVIERSDVSSRQDEGLQSRTGVLRGSEIDEVRFHESDMTFLANPMSGQKTGFYLDQRDLRSAVRAHAKGLDVLNIFSYTGATSVAAAAGGATRVHNVDSSASALELCVRHAKENGLSDDMFTTEEVDAFQWLGDRGEDELFGMVIIDPPALIKTRKDDERGKKAYHFLNRAAMRLVRDGGIFVTSSCSRHLSREDLEFILRRASVQAGIRLHILAMPGQPADHPVSLYFPESAYLKSYVFAVERL